MRPFIRQAQIDQAVHYLKQGGVIAMPTETVYGLAADAKNEVAIHKIFAIKGRPTDHPLIVHIATIDKLVDWARDIPIYAIQLAGHFWPGPMTLILKKQPHVLESVTGGQDSIGLRIPNHIIAQQLLNSFEGGLAAPSANRFGYISPTTAQHVREDLGNAIDMILDGGNCGIGIESTIIDCTGESPRILRPGMITQQMIEEAIKTNSLSTEPLINYTPRVSGALLSHYAPKTKTRLVSANDIDKQLDKKNIAVLSIRKPQHHHVKIYDSRIPHRQIMSNPNIIHWILMPSEPHAYAHRLYDQLHFAEKLSCNEIWIEHVPTGFEWQGINDRISKASHR